jgi:spore coat polysaccharide biosynthesis protein SpsF
MNLKKVLLILQSRQSSSRLPNKCLLPIKKKTLIEIIINRVKSPKYDLVVATSSDHSDDLLCNILEKTKIKIYRGSLLDVKKRILKLTKNLSDKHIIIRLTADNTFPDKKLIIKMLNFFKKEKKEYLFINQNANNVPYGLSVEIFKLKILRNLKKNSWLDKEHVTINFPKRHNVFNNNLNINFNKKNHKCSVDTIEDYFLIKNFFEKCVNSINLDWEKLCYIFFKKFYKLKKFFRITKSLNDISNKLIIGTAQFGGLYGISNKIQIAKADIKKIIYFCSKIGVRHYDTARDYKNSEKVFGNLKLPKEKYLVDTKISNKVLLKGDNFDLFFKKSFNESKFFLKEKKFNILYIHNLSENYLLNKKLLDYAVHLKKLNQIKYVGISISNFKDLEKIVNSNLIKKINVVQLPFNIVDRSILKNNIINRLKKNKIKIIIRSIFLQGLFFSPKKYWPKNIRYLYNIMNYKLINFVKKFNRDSVADLMVGFIKSFSFYNKIIVGFNDFSNFTEFYYYFNKPALKKKELALILSEFNNLPKELNNPFLWKK